MQQILKCLNYFLLKHCDICIKLLMFPWITNNKLKLNIRVPVYPILGVALLSFNCSAQELLLRYFSLTLNSKPGVSIQTLLESAVNMKFTICLVQPLYFLLPSTSTLKTGSTLVTHVTWLLLPSVSRHTQEPASVSFLFLGFC